MENMQVVHMHAGIYLYICLKAWFECINMMPGMNAIMNKLTMEEE
jgi:hypothetical protein